MTSPELDAHRIFDVLDRHHVDYVVLGGYAAQLYGARRPTTDVDVAPATTEDNLTRLVAALRELQAGIRVNDVPDGLPFDTSADALRGMKMLNLRTPHGDMDLTFSPAGFPAGYDDLIGHARPHLVDGVTVQVAALNDIITSKTAAGRQKDLQALPELRRLAADQPAVGDLAPRRATWALIVTRS
ncbi:MAG: hypothetical protein M3N95_06335 [Actinomycetota bacterium]|nr:hypothetical protein [Actinomycetota bacterium]